MDKEDFTFPIPTQNYSTLLSVDSSPWWCIASSSSSLKISENKKDEELENCSSASTSFSCGGTRFLEDVEAGIKVENKDEEEKMDMLWEHFNEEKLSKSCRESDMPSSRRMVGLGLGCSQAFKLAKVSGCEKRSMAAFIKVLKKFLLLHNPQPSLKNGRL